MRDRGIQNTMDDDSYGAKALRKRLSLHFPEESVGRIMRLILSHSYTEQELILLADLPENTDFLIYVVAASILPLHTSPMSMSTGLVPEPKFNQPPPSGPGPTTMPGPPPQPRLRILPEGDASNIRISDLNPEPSGGFRSGSTHGDINSRKIYMSFPAESTFTERDLADYFSTYGTVEHVTIPGEERYRTYAFVIFEKAETVKAVLARNPHHLGSDRSRIFVKPHKDSLNPERSGFENNDSLATYFNPQNQANAGSGSTGLTDHHSQPRLCGNNNTIPPSMDELLTSSFKRFYLDANSNNPVNHSIDQDRSGFENHNYPRHYELQSTDFNPQNRARLGSTSLSNHPPQLRLNADNNTISPSMYELFTSSFARFHIDANSNNPANNSTDQDSNEGHRPPSTQ